MTYAEARGPAPRPARRRARGHAPGARAHRGAARRARAPRAAIHGWSRSAAPTARARWRRCWPRCSRPPAAASASTPRRISSRSASASAWTASRSPRTRVVDGVEALGTLVARLDATMFEATTALALDHFAREARRRRGARGRARRAPRRHHGGNARRSTVTHAHRPRPPGSASATPSTRSPARRPRSSGRAPPSPRRKRPRPSASSWRAPPRPACRSCSRAATCRSRCARRGPDGQRSTARARAGPARRSRAPAARHLSAGQRPAGRDSRPTCWASATRAIRDGLARARWPGRFEVRRRAAAGSCWTAPTTRPARAPSPRRCATLFGDTRDHASSSACFADKDAAGILAPLLGRARRVVLTAPPTRGRPRPRLFAASCPPRCR